jgi:excisionase family DNA binding protein
MSAQRPSGRGGALDDQDWLTLGQAARFLGVAQSTIRKWSDQGRIPVFYTPGGHRRFRRVHLDSFVDDSRQGGRQAGPLVLLVEHDGSVRAPLRAELERAGYSVAEADGGEQALAAIADRAPELVLLDLVLPGADGWQLLRQLQERHGSIPVIVFNGTVDVSASAAGADAPPARPFDPTELLSQARRLVPV